MTDQLRVTIRPNDMLASYLRALAQTGLYGPDLDDVVLRLVEQQIQQLIGSGMIGVGR